MELCGCFLSVFATLYYDISIYKIISPVFCFLVDDQHLGGEILQPNIIKITKMPRCQGY